MKRIVFFTFLDLWSMGKGRGAPSFHKTLEAYRDAGWDVHLISPMRSTEAIKALEGITAHRIALPLPGFLGVRRLGFAVRLLRTLLGAIQQFTFGARLVWRHRDHTVLYAYEVYGVLPAKVLACVYGVPLVTRFQGTILAPLKNTLFNRIARFPHFEALAAKADIVIMTDDGTQGDKVLERVGNQSPIQKFWRNGVDRQPKQSELNDEPSTTRRQLGIPSDAIVLLTVSRLASWKRVDRAVETLAAITATSPEVFLVVVGDGPEAAALHDLAKKKSVSDRVLFVGAVPQSTVSEYYSIANIFLSLYELSNLGNPLFEAMFSGLPIVTIDVGDTSRVVEDGVNGVLLSSPAISEIAASVEFLIARKSVRDALGASAAVYAASNFWSWSARMQTEVASVEGLLP